MQSQYISCRLCNLLVFVTLNGMTADIGITARSATSHFTWEKVVLKCQKAISWSEKVNLLVKFNSSLQRREIDFSY